MGRPDAAPHPWRLADTRWALETVLRAVAAFDRETANANHDDPNVGNEMGRSLLVYVSMSLRGPKRTQFRVKVKSLSILSASACLGSRWYIVHTKMIKHRQNKEDQF